MSESLAKRGASRMVGEVGKPNTFCPSTPRFARRSGPFVSPLPIFHLTKSQVNRRWLAMSESLAKRGASRMASPRGFEPRLQA